MADPISITASAIQVLGQAFQQSEEVLRLRDQQYNVRQLVLDINASLQKFQVWHRTWSAEEKHPDVSAEALWGAQGWKHLHRMLEVIGETSQDLAKSLQELKMKANEESKPRLRWKRAYRAFQTKREPSAKMRQLQEWSATLTRTVDELWIYSEAVFDSLHGIWSQELMIPERDKLLDIALRSRPCSLEVYSHCSVSRHSCSLKMDLLNNGDAHHKALYISSGASLSVFYRLVTQLRGAHSSLQQLTIERVGSPVSPVLSGDNELVQSIENLQLFKPTASQRTLFVKVASRGSAQDSYLRIPQKEIQSIKLSRSLETLAGVLDGQQSTGLPIGEPPPEERLSIGAKFELAYKVVECGFFLLGTPWFASLSSKTLRRFKGTDEPGESYCLEPQTSDLEDILFDDPDALAEPSQLFRLGVLLMEIALDRSDLYSKSDESEQEAIRIRNLPLVEHIMGSQYCKAMTFCLQYRQSGKPYESSKTSPNTRAFRDGRRYREAEKYNDANFDDWQGYLAELLQQYYAQVYLRIQALRDIDGDDKSSIGGFAKGA